MKKISVNDDNINEIVDIIYDNLKLFDNFDIVKDKIDIIIKSIKNDIKNILIIDEYLYINVYGACYGVNYDFKNYPLFSFYCQSLRFENNDCGYIHDEYADVSINLHELDLRNFEKIN